MSIITRARFAKPFSADRLQALLAISADLEKTLELSDGGWLPERFLFRALFQAAYDTGLSIRQLLALDWRAIQPDGRIEIEVRLSRPTLFLLARLADPARPAVFMLPEDYDFTQRLKLIRTWAGFEARDGKGGAE